VRRQPEQSVLHGVVRAHLGTFVAEARQRGGGEGLPRFVERSSAITALAVTVGIAAGFASVIGSLVMPPLRAGVHDI